MLPIVKSPYVTHTCYGLRLQLHGVEEAFYWKCNKDMKGGMGSLEVATTYATQDIVESMVAFVQEWVTVKIEAVKFVPEKEKEDVIVTIKGKAIFEVYFETTFGTFKSDDYADEVMSYIDDSYESLYLTDLEGRIKFKGVEINAITSHEVVKVEEG